MSNFIKRVTQKLFILSNFIFAPGGPLNSSMSGVLTINHKFTPRGMKRE